MGERAEPEEAEEPEEAAEPEEALTGGVDHAGEVVRVGDTVRRPGGQAAPQVRLFLDHLHQAGFAGAPRFLGVDERGREVLGFVPGQVALSPYPDWLAEDEPLISIARLQAGLHRAAAGFRLPDGMDWPARRLPPGARGELVCHADLCVENVVFRDGRAAAFIDFDLATPADPLFDIAVAARHWVPLRDPADIADARAGTDLARRFALFTGAHGLDGARRHRLLGMLASFLDDALTSIRLHAESGHPGFARMWAEGYEGMNRRSRAWLAGHVAELCG